jgi:oligoribonuclease
MKLLFLDLETTGLTDDDTILEVGAILYDIKEAKEISRKQMLVRHHIKRQFLAMPRVVYDMHMKSGLLTEIGHELGTRDIEEAVIQMILNAGMSSGECIMAGFSPHFDRRFMRRLMPSLESFLHHRNIDVSTLRELTLAWTRSKPDKIDRHRAIPDCEEAIATLMSYRKLIAPIV